MLKLKNLLGIGLLLVLGVVVVGGCGKGPGTNYYYYPNWTPEGKIICIKKNVVSGSGSWVFPGGEEVYYYITTMSDAGTQETDVKRINMMGQVVASPLGNYIGVTEWKSLRIFTSAGVDVKTIDLGERMNSFDWSPDETRIVYSGEESKDLYILRISDEVKTKIVTGVAEVAWRYGEFILYGDVSTNPSKMAKIKEDGSNYSQIAFGLNPQLTNGGNIVFGGYGTEGGKVKSITLNSSDEAELFSGYERASLALSFDNTKIAGGDLDGYGSIKGIWVYAIDGTEQAKLR